MGNGAKWLTSAIILQIRTLLTPRVIKLIMLNAAWLGPLLLALLQMVQTFIAQLRAGGVDLVASAGRLTAMMALADALGEQFQRLHVLEQIKGRLLANGRGVYQAIEGGSRQLMRI